MEQVINKKRGKLARLAVILAVLVLLAVGTAASIKAFAYDFHGIDISDRESIDAYFIDIDVSAYKGVHCSIEKGVPYADFWTRKNMRLALLFSFPNVKLTNTHTGTNGTPYLITETELNTPEGISLNNFNISARYDFTNTTFKISLSNNFYKAIKDSPQESAFNTVQIMLLYDNNGFSTVDNPWWNANGRTYSVSTRFYSTAVSPSIADPDSDDFDINFGNNGDAVLPDNETSDGEPNTWDMIWDWLKINWQMVLIIALVAVVGAVALKFFFWVFK